MNPRLEAVGTLLAALAAFMLWVTVFAWIVG